jgi:hypothetical protein
MRKPTLLTILLLVVFVATGMAQETEEDELFVPTNSLGDQTLGINLGLFVPLFFSGSPDGYEAANLSLGGVGSLRWESYLNNEWKVGAELGGSFSFTPNGRALFLVPISARGSYIFNAYPWEFPVTVGAGINFASLDELVKVDPFVKAGGGAYWNFSTQWAFGLDAFWWIIPQVYFSGSPAGASETRVGNFLEITLSALYHF